MFVWRVCKARHAASAFTGLGAEKAGGRWNHKGDKVVYTSSTLSLAKLELFVHFTAETAPDDLVYLRAKIPDNSSIETIAASDLPDDWRAFPSINELKDIGSEWGKSGRTFLLQVPSAITPEEANYLINPAHREFKTISIDRPVAFSFDQRMWK